ncbi:uncharacterized protein LOC133814944 [Humulus lupulus]|uniref:uncharacterized protein LOC133814944 n=1 Tax=Humulus lupulus TaxID=3486 RepID=UPI002B410858|nr:uncharacterized protein LOC133814944 [Humulus lupulus]
MTFMTRALAAFAQLNYKLNNELKLADEFKAAKSKLEAELEEKNSRIKELEEENSRVKELKKLNAKLEEEKKATFDIMEGEKARLLEEFKQKKDRAVDMAMYKIWANNVDLDTSFLGTLEDELLAKWQARLEAKEVEEEAEKAKEMPDAAGGDAPAS